MGKRGIILKALYDLNLGDEANQLIRQLDNEYGSQLQQIKNEITEDINRISGNDEEALVPVKEVLKSVLLAGKDLD